MGGHGAIVTAALLLSVHQPRTAAGDRLTEFDVRPPARAVSTPEPARSAGPPAPGARPRSVRGLNLGPAAPASISYQDADFVAPTAGDPDGDEDWTFDGPSPSTLGGGSGDGAATGALPARTIEKPIAPLEAAYLCTYQSLRGLPRSLYVRGRSYKLVVKMCIGSDGRVEGVSLEKGAAAELDAQVVADMHHWHYRPRIVGGKPSAFCYKVNVTYEVD
jgi:hypothetical protein